MKHLKATLYFKSYDDALRAGYCDAVHNGKDDYEYHIEFKCDDFFIEHLGDVEDPFMKVNEAAMKVFGTEL